MLENEVDQDERQELEEAIRMYSECIKKLDGKILGCPTNTSTRRNFVTTSYSLCSLIAIT